MAARLPGADLGSKQSGGDETTAQGVVREQGWTATRARLPSVGAAYQAMKAELAVSVAAVTMKWTGRIRRRQRLPVGLSASLALQRLQHFRIDFLIAY
jgi:hypothetical protein